MSPALQGFQHLASGLANRKDQEDVPELGLVPLVPLRQFLRCQAEQTGM